MQLSIFEADKACEANQVQSPEIEQITRDVCHHRIQINEPCFFVSWKENGKQNYEFFQLNFAAANFEERLIKRQKKNLIERINKIAADHN